LLGINRALQDRLATITLHRWHAGTSSMYVGQSSLPEEMLQRAGGSRTGEAPDDAAWRQRKEEDDAAARRALER
jgi:hypothetical protein